MGVPLTGISEEQRQQTAETAIKNSAVAEYQQNRECADGLKKLIDKKFDGYRLDTDKVLATAINAFRERRVELALASTIEHEPSFPARSRRYRSHDFPTFGAPAKMNSPVERIPSIQNSIGFSGVVISCSQFTVLSSFNKLSSCQKNSKRKNPAEDRRDCPL